jgi:hypothetical protein
MYAMISGFARVSCGVMVKVMRESDRCLSIPLAFKFLHK